MRKLLQVISVLLTVSLALAACGGSSSDDPEELALSQIDYALDQVDDIYILADPFMTTVFQTTMKTRLRQAREYLLSGDKSNAIERLSLVKLDAEDLMANYAGIVEGSPSSIRDACRRAITFIRAMP